MDLPEEERISLDSNVSSGGGNFSLGQRQILALARALVRQSKVLILDEATASLGMNRPFFNLLHSVNLFFLYMLDHQTDTLVQKSLSTEFKDCTLITVAHRLQTIMNSDKILVLNEGRLVEFDSPANLLQKEDGVFKGMVDRSGDKETLYGLVVPEPGASSQ
jgi:ABC-type multidrug transport system fused ATPase/permease subunit